MLIEKGLRRDHEAGRAEAALLRVVINIGLLHRMRLLAGHQPFGGSDLVPLRFDCERRARVNRPTINQHGARATLATIADALGSGYVKLLAQRVEQRHAWLELCVQALAVDAQRNRHRPWAVHRNLRTAGLHHLRPLHQRYGCGQASDLEEVTSRNSRFNFFVELAHETSTTGIAARAVRESREVYNSGKNEISPGSREWDARRRTRLRAAKRAPSNDKDNCKQNQECGD